MTTEERKRFLQRMDHDDYVMTVLLVMAAFALLPLLGLWMELMFSAESSGVMPIFRSFFRHFVPVEILMLLCGFFLGSVIWLMQGVFARLGFVRTLV